jgi:Uma2 family endonuclease
MIEQLLIPAESLILDESEIPNVDYLITEDDTSESLILDESLIPNIDHLITEDDTPVDNFASAKQQRLLTSTLYSTLDVVFLAEANVGIYHAVKSPPIVPDVFVSFDVEVPENWWEKQQRCYMLWNFGKPPEITIEIVSNTVGDELGKKLAIYENMRVSYYIVYDPSHKISPESLRIFELSGRRYHEISSHWLEQVNLGLILWDGEFEGRSDNWLRWCDGDKNILLTGDERANQEQQRANQERQRADEQQFKAEKIQQTAIAQFLKLGLTPEQIAETLSLPIDEINQASDRIVG